MKPGRELDALIAGKVMGWERINKGWGDPNGDIGKPPNSAFGRYIPKYSTSIEAAWEVVEKLYLPFEINCDDEHTLWNVRFNLDRGEWTQSHTAAHAICLAALKAVES